MLTCNASPGGPRKPRLSQRLLGTLLWLCVVLLAFAVVFIAFVQQAYSEERESFCTTTARAAMNACYNGARDSYWTTIGNCANVSDVGIRYQCLKQAEVTLRSATELCEDQLLARRELCGDLGEARYDPDWDPANFVDPLDIGDGVTPNPLFPLDQGRHWIYQSDDQRTTSTVTVTAATKQVGGVTCLVVNSLVVAEGEVIENTDDWYAQDLEGTVWYCGEIDLNFQTLEGDHPQLAELVDIDGSWKAFRDHAKPGVVMPAVPRVGEVYRQESALGETEDAAEVLSRTGSARVSAPGASCRGTCLVTRDFTPIEPGAEEHRFYAPGVGLILVLDPATGERSELVSMLP